MTISSVPSITGLFFFYHPVRKTRQRKIFTQHSWQSNTTAGYSRLVFTSKSLSVCVPLNL